MRNSRGIYHCKSVIVFLMQQMPMTNLSTSLEMLERAVLWDKTLIF